MAATCSICPRPDRARLDAALLAGVPRRTVAAQADPPRPSASAVQRHRRHIASAIADAQAARRTEAGRAHDARAIADADGLLVKIEDLEVTARRLLDKSEKRGNLGVSVQALRELKGVVELLARITGELRGDGVSINLFAAPEWPGLQRRLLEALAPYPDAKHAAARALLPAGDPEAADA